MMNHVLLVQHSAFILVFQGRPFNSDFMRLSFLSARLGKKYENNEHVPTVLFASTITVSSQTGDQPHEQYAMWKRSVMSSLGNTEHLFYYRVATLVKRIDDNYVQVKIAVAGRVPSYSFFFQPIGVLRSPDPEAEQEAAGREQAWNVAKALKQSGYGKMVDLEQVLEVEPEASAIKISVKPNSDIGQPQETVPVKSIVELTDQWSFRETTTFVPQPPESR